MNRELFLEIWEMFCYYFVEYIMYHFGLYLFSSSMPMILWLSFDGFAEFLHILLQILVFCLSSSVFLQYLFCLQVMRFCLPLVLVFCIGIPLFDLRNFLFPGFLFLFSEVLHSFVKFLFHILICLLYFIYLCFYNLCFTLEYVKVLSEFI
jgi:hypothetical protein